MNLSQNSQPKIEAPKIHIYTGDGKGKTTAALGLAFRAAGHGFRVRIIQFMKGSIYSGETISAARLAPHIYIDHFGRECPNSLSIAMGWTKCTGCGECFIKKGEATEEDLRQADDACNKVIEIYENDRAEMVILDELVNAINFGLIDIDKAIELIKKRPDDVELVITGRNVPQKLIELADLVTEMKCIKHPFNEGLSARRGVEY